MEKGSQELSMESFDELFGRGMINHLLSQVIAMGLTVFVIPGLSITGLFGAIRILVAISLVNAFLWDASLFFALPQNLTVMSAQLFLANGVIFWVLVKLLPGIEVNGVLPAIIAPCIFSLTSALLHNYAGAVDWMGLLVLLFDKIISIKNSFMEPNSNGG